MLAVIVRWVAVVLLATEITSPVAPGPPAASAPLPRAPGAHVATASPAAGSWSEPSIAVDPHDRSRVVAVFQPATAAYSTDSGRTFSPSGPIAPTDWRTAGDVSTTFDAHGIAYVAYLVFDKLGSASYWRHGAGRNGIYVRRSLDGGRTWEAKAIPIKVWYTGKEPGLQYEDMPRIFADNAPDSPHRGSLYAGWIEWQLDKSIMLFSRSTDQGRTWSAPMRISTQPGYPRDDNGDVVGFIGTVGADGTIYTVWNWKSTITLAVSRDGGRSFSPSRPVVDVGPPYFGGTGAVPGVSRVFGFPQIGVDWRAGHVDRVYVSWSDYRNGDVDVFVAASADQGRTWSAPVRVNGDSVHDGRDQFFQWMAVDPVTGNVYVQFYDRGADPENRLTSVTLARSPDGARTFTSYRWSDQPFEGRGAFLGDYTWMTVYDGHIHGVWAEAEASSDSTSAEPRRRPRTVMKVGTAVFP
ncbi:MAG TPA: sialidase family protein [Gemmatimonadaceae bacterium]|nr:sialidase family protein [Gemmatimonadaceae bacterium]